MNRYLSTLTICVCVLLMSVFASAQSFVGDSGGGGSGISGSLVCQLTGSTNCTMTGSTVYSAVSGDITTGTNEDLTLTPNGTGSVQLRSGDSAVDLQDSAGSTRGNIWSATASNAVMFGSATSGGGIFASLSSLGAAGASSSITDTSTVFAVAESITSTTGNLGTVHWRMSGGGMERYQTEQTLTCADNGSGTAAAANLNPTASTVLVTNNDANGCVVTLQETTVNTFGTGSVVRIIVISSSGGTVSFPDVAGVANTGGICNTGMGADDAMSLMYANETDDQWVMIGCADN